MKRTELPTQLQALLRHIPYVTIATVSSGGLPWSTPMVGHFDSKMNLYWVTTKISQHSRNIAGNSHIFVTVFDTSAPLGTGLGVYLQMQAQELQSSAAIIQACKLSGMNFTENLQDHPDFLGDCPRRMYRAIPERIWYNGNADYDGHTVDVRLELTK